MLERGTSEVVATACGWCGGPRMIVYTTDHGHAEWCPKYNPASALVCPATHGPVTRDEHDEMVELFLDGAEIVEIARKLERNVSTIRQHLQRELGMDLRSWRYA